MLDFLANFDIAALLMVILIDIVMSGDNAIIIGLAAAGLPPELRRRAIIYGIVLAAGIRIVFASIVLQLLAIIGLTLAGGLLLAWVCWRMWKELRAHTLEGHIAEDMEATLEGEAVTANQGGADVVPAKTLRAAMISIVVADVSMSLDNVLAVAGAARDNIGILAFGLILSIALMGLAANYIAKLLERHHWLAYIGLAIIVYVAGDMIWRGTHEIAAVVAQTGG